MENMRSAIKIDPVSFFHAALFIGGAFVIWKAWSILILLVTAVVIAIFIEAIAKLLTRLRVPRSLAVIIVYVGGLALFSYLMIALIPVFITELANLKKILPQVEALQKITNTFSSTNGVSLLDVDPKVFVNRIQGSFSGLSSGFLTFFNSIFGSAANMILLLVLSLYLALEDRAIERLLRSIIPAQKEEYAVRLWIRVRSKVENWFKGQLIVAIITAVLTFIGLLIIGVPNALLMGLVAGVFGMVPFGILIALIPAALLAFFHGGTITMIYVGALYWLLQQLLDYFIGPLIVRRATGLPSLVIVISFVLSISLIGFLGFFLAIPMAILVLEIIADFERKKVLPISEELVELPEPENITSPETTP